MNNQTTPIPSTLLRNKLGNLAQRLQQNANLLGAGQASLEFNTLEKTVSEALKILSQFYKNLSSPGFNPVYTKRDTVPDIKSFNENFLLIQDDLITLFSEFENLEGVVLGEFNYAVSRINRLNKRLKSVSSSLGDYILFSNLPTKDALFFTDSFNNIEKIESNSSLLNNEQVEINQVEGIVTLPVDRTAQSKINISETPIINSNSNGRSGNNEQANAQFHGTISDILDGNADTWFEYERVLSVDDGKALVFDFTINLGEPKIINFIRINPNNFGTRTQVEVLTIDTSVDGKSFVSVKDDIPISGIVTEDEANVFILAPSTSKYAGQGLYTFTPREAKYIRLSLQQTTPYIITTSNNKNKFRYAIGIRDIEVQALPYKKIGEFISTELSVLNDEIRKISLTSSQNPIASTTSQLVSIDHFISPDNGVTWYPIRAKESSGVSNTSQTIPEILDFNGVSQNTIQVKNAVSSIRYKAILKRNTEAFTSNASELFQEKEYTTELHVAPLTTPFTITLQNQPIKDTLKLIDPQYGSRGKTDTKYNIALGTGQKLTINLPFKPLVRDFDKDLTGSYPQLVDKQPEKIYVDGELWTNSGLITGTSNIYRMNYEEGKIEFGDGTNGKSVAKGSAITMILEEERLFPSRGTDHVTSLNYPTSNDKKQMEIYIAYPSEHKTQVLKKGTKRHQLSPDIIYNTSTKLAYSTGENRLIINKPSGSTTFTSEKVFNNGSAELTGTGHYSIDFTNGVLYSYDYTDNANDTSISYKYNPRTKLKEDDWSFINSSNGITDSISIADKAFITFKADEFSIDDGVKYFNLPHLAIVKGTLAFSTTSSTAVPSQLSQEVNYVDGRSELLGLIEISEELDAISGSGKKYIAFKTKIVNDIGYSVSFSNRNIFKEEKLTDGAVTSTGDYYIDRTASPTGQIVFMSDGDTAIPGSVKYYYQDPKANLTGRYSVNYITGEVFTYSATPSNAVANYEYTDYRARYDIARLVSVDDWTFNEAAKKIIIKDREILRGQKIPQAPTNASASTINRYYQASYEYVKQTRTNASKLEPFYSPILKEYSLKIITKGKLL